MGPSTRLVISVFAARWMGRKQIVGLKYQGGCSTARHTLTSTFDSSAVCQQRRTCGVLCASRSGVEGSNAISRPAFWGIQSLSRPELSRDLCHARRTDTVDDRGCRSRWICSGAACRTTRAAPKSLMRQMIHSLEGVSIHSSGKWLRTFSCVMP